MLYEILNLYKFVKKIRKLKSSKYKTIFILIVSIKNNKNKKESLIKLFQQSNNIKFNSKTKKTKQNHIIYRNINYVHHLKLVFLKKKLQISWSCVLNSSLCIFLNSTRSLFSYVVVDLAWSFFLKIFFSKKKLKWRHSNSFLVS